MLVKESVVSYYDVKSTCRTCLSIRLLSLIKGHTFKIWVFKLFEVIQHLGNQRLRMGDLKASSGVEYLGGNIYLKSIVAGLRKDTFNIPH